MRPSEALAPVLRDLAGLVDGAVPLGESHVRRGPVWALRATRPSAPAHAMYTPMLCVIAQGRKQLRVGDDLYVYDAGRFLLNTVAVPGSGQVVEASAERPCLWVMIELDPALVLSVMSEARLPVRPEPPRRAMETNPIDAPTLDAVVRLARLFSAPGDAGFLAPLLMREIFYRLLAGDQGARLRQVAAQGGSAHRVARAVEWLRDHFDRPFSVEELAYECGMSPSSLHHQFKEVTAMSPLQFQKRMRLQEANRLMVAEGLDAASAGLRVGYEDPAYFSREYRRFFGDPPRRHVARARRGSTVPIEIPHLDRDGRATS